MQILQKFYEKITFQTADQVKDNYNNQNFMPQKNELKDVPYLMKMSKEFNPIVSFDVVSMDQSGSAVTSSY